jgi:hypothetical protein
LRSYPDKFPVYGETKLLDLPHLKCVLSLILEIPFGKIPNCWMLTTDIYLGHGMMDSDAL